jgi:hypothetical protein
MVFGEFQKVSFVNQCHGRQESLAQDLRVLKELGGLFRETSLGVGEVDQR